MSNQPAFPLPLQLNEHGHVYQDSHDGMLMLDYFAAKAMQTLLSQITEFPDEHWRVGLALDAYSMADAMITAKQIIAQKESSK